MAIFRINKTQDYTVMSNAHFKDKRLTLKAKGLLSLMLSLPDGWDYSVDGLCKLSKDGKDSVGAAIKELEKCGYLIRTQNTKNGRFDGYIYDIYETPQTEKPFTENPSTENPSTENPQQLNTIYYKIHTDKILIKDIVDFLNTQANTHYRADSATTVKHIKARIAEGYALDDFKTVIIKMCKAWKGSKMEQYLRPETLFGAKFESYLNATIKERSDVLTHDYDKETLRNVFVDFE